MAIKIPTNCTFDIQDETRTAVITAIDDGTEMEVSVSYGIIRDADQKPKFSRFAIEVETTILGRDVTLGALGADMNAALKNFVTSELNADPNDYAFRYDEDDEFFSQKFVVKGPAKGDIWNNEKFADKLDTLRELRAETEGELATAKDQDADTEAAYLALGQTLLKVKSIIGNDRAALASWAQGAKSEDQGNYQLLTQLGKGNNALHEAMVIAELTPTEFNVKPRSMLSGKAIDKMFADSVREVVDVGNMNKMVADIDVNLEVPDMDTVEDMLRHMLSQAYRIEAATETDDGGQYTRRLVDLVDDAEEYAGKVAAEFLAKYGKDVNMYNKEQSIAARLAFGYVHMSSRGREIISALVDTIEAYYATDGDSEEGQEARRKLRDKLFAKTAGNRLAKTMWTATKTHAQRVAQERRNRDAVKSITDDGAARDVVSKTARKQFSGLDPLTAAALVYDLIQSHQTPDRVEAHLKSLMAQGVKIPAGDKASDKAA